MIEIEFKEDRAIKQAEGNIEQALKDYTLALGKEVLKDALEFLKTGDPYNHWVTGQLGNSGRVDDSNLEQFEVDVVFTAPHAIFLEYGTDPHVAPLGPSLDPEATSIDKTENPLDWWAWKVADHEIKKYGKYGYHTPLGFGIWIKIMKVGTDPHPYLRPAVTKVKGKKDRIAKKYGLEFE